MVLVMAMYWLALQLDPDAAQPEAAAPALGDAATLVDPLTALAWCVLQFTPKVARVGDVLLLELSGSERLFGGRRALLRRMGQVLAPVARVRRAPGATGRSPGTPAQAAGRRAPAPARR